MRNLNVFLLLLVLGLTGCTTTQVAKQPSNPDIQTVEVTGVGNTPEAARKNALFTAVEQVVGALVDARIDIKDNELLQERILTLSDGYINDFTVLNPAHKVENVFHETIRADVQRTRLMSSIAEQNVALNSSVRGELLYAQAVSQDRVREQAVEIIKALLSEDPRQFKAEITGSVSRVDPATLTSEAIAISHYWIQVPIRIYIDNTHLNYSVIPKLTRVLETIASTNLKKSTSYAPNYRIKVPNQKYNVNLVSPVSEFIFTGRIKKYGQGLGGGSGYDFADLNRELNQFFSANRGIMVPRSDGQRQLYKMESTDSFYKPTAASSFTILQSPDTQGSAKSRESDRWWSYELAPYYYDEIRKYLSTTYPEKIKYLVGLDFLDSGGRLLDRQMSYLNIESFWLFEKRINIAAVFGNIDYSGSNYWGFYDHLIHGISFAATFPVTAEFLNSLTEVKIWLETDSEKIKELAHSSNMNGIKSLKNALKKAKPYAYVINDMLKDLGE